MAVNNSNEVATVFVSTRTEQERSKQRCKELTPAKTVFFY